MTGDNQRHTCVLPCRRKGERKDAHSFAGVIIIIEPGVKKMGIA
jgi:hypothetical protein